MLKILIVDDESASRDSLRWLIEEYYSIEAIIVAEAANLPEAVKAFYTFQPGLIFLDIEMPNYSGMELKQMLGADQNEVDIVFVTAHAQYAVQAFEQNASNYLLKPVKLIDLKRAVDKVLQKNLIANAFEHTTTLLQDRITVNTGDGLQIIKTEDILFFKGDGVYVQIITSASAKPIIVNRRLYDFDKLQASSTFLRIHRSYIVNTKHIEKILKGDSGVLLSNQEVLSVSKDHRQALIDFFENMKI
jgi:two-component system, LytTR family, response regulator